MINKTKLLLFILVSIGIYIFIFVNFELKVREIENQSEISEWMRFPNNNTIIPRTIFFTYKYNLFKKRYHVSNNSNPNYFDVDSLLKNIELIKQINHGYKFYFFDDEMSYNYIKTNYSLEMAEMFQNEQKGAYKADIFRLIVLYNEGGYYCDIDLEPKIHKPFHELLKNMTTFASVESHTDGKGNIFQAFLAGIPKHEIFRINIERFINYYRKPIPERENCPNLGTVLMKQSITIFIKTIGLNTTISEMQIKSYQNYKFFTKHKIQLFIQCVYTVNIFDRPFYGHPSQKFCPKPIGNRERMRWFLGYKWRAVVVDPYKYINPFVVDTMTDSDILFYSRIMGT